MALDTLIFGVDGVLAETQEARRETYNDVFREAGLKWNWSRALYADLLKSTHSGDLIRDYAETHLSGSRHQKNVSTMISAMKRHHASLFAERITSRKVGLRTGVAEFLAAAERAEMRFAIVTTEEEHTVTALLNAELPQTTAARFEIVTPKDCPTRDSQSTMHTDAAEILGLSSRRSLVVESKVCGLRSALAAKLPVVLTWGKYTQLQECGEALWNRDDDSLRSPSSAIVGYWDCLASDDLVAHLREIHATQIRVRQPRHELTLEAASTL